MPTASLSAPSSAKHRPIPEPEPAPEPPAEPAVAAEPVDAEFKLLSPYALVVPARSHGGIFSNPVFGEIAHLPNRGRVARWASRFPSGVVDFSYRTDPAEVDVQQETLHIAADETGVVLAALEQARLDAKRRMTTVELTPLEIERDRFAAQYPLVAEFLQVSRARPHRLFEPGPCWRPTAFNPACGEIEWAAHRDRHTAGEWGDHGSFDPAPLTAEEIWSISLQPAAVRNRHTIATGQGVIRSRYPLPIRQGDVAFALNVLTAFIPGRSPVTIMLPQPSAVSL
jgi:hypothetical protein